MIINGTESCRGARHEINFADTNRPGGTWYDVDYEYGMSSSALGPSENRPRIMNGKNESPIAGEEKHPIQGQEGLVEADNDR